MGAQQETVVREMLAAWGDRDNPRDLERIVAGFADDARWTLYMPDGPTVIGRNAIRAELERQATYVEAVESEVVLIASSGDMVIAAEEAFFVTGYGLIGLSPDCAVSWTLARGLGVPRAMGLYVTNRKLSAAEAYAAGLLTRVVPRDQLDAAVDELVAAVVASSASAVAQTKRLMRTAWSRSRDEQMSDEASTIGTLGDEPPAREGFAAFVAKRRPDFG